LSNAIECAHCGGALSGRKPHHRVQYSENPLYFHDNGDGCKDAALAIWRRRGGGIRYINPNDK